MTHKKFISAEGFPHLVVPDMGNLFSKKFLKECANTFPRENEIPWHSFDNGRERKLACNNPDFFPKNIIQLLEYLQSDYFVVALGELTGVSGLVSDPTLLGGGLHCIPQGGHLGIHSDFNFHPTLRMERKLNVLVYLNSEWEDQWGGHLELWHNGSCMKRVRPDLGKMVIFQTNADSLHGHPHPLQTPEGVSRNSLALYYYAPGMPEHVDSTIFHEIPENYSYKNVPIV